MMYFGPADFTRDVALNYVKRGYHLLCRHAITLFLLPVGGTILVCTYPAL